MYQALLLLLDPLMWRGKKEVVEVEDFENVLKQIVVHVESCTYVNEIDFGLVIGIMKLCPTPDPL